MNRLKYAVAVCCALALASGCRSAEVMTESDFKDLALGAGCKNPAKKTEFEYNEAGWGGPELKYSFDAKANVYVIERGMLVNRDFRWAESEISFEFKDTPELVWGARLMDLVFRPARWRDLLAPGTVLLEGPRKFRPAMKLTPDRLWTLWPRDLVMEVGFAPVQDGLQYKVLRGWSHERILGDGLTSIKAQESHEVAVLRDSWNTFKARISRGEFTYSLNGRGGVASFHLDPRLNGRLGILVVSGGPLCIRNLKYSPQVRAQDAAKP